MITLINFLNILMIQLFCKYFHFLELFCLITGSNCTYLGLRLSKMQTVLIGDKIIGLLLMRPLREAETGHTFKVEDEYIREASLGSDNEVLVRKGYYFY